MNEAGTERRADRVREAFTGQAEACEKLGSPFTGRLCRIIGERLEAGYPVADRILEWPGDPSSGADSVPLRLMGALRAISMNLPQGPLAAVYPPHAVAHDDDSLWSAVGQTLMEEQEFILHRLEYAPQTNEIGRSSVIICGLSLIAGEFGLPIVLSELGASAGLNLLADRYSHELAGQSLGNAGSPVRLSPTWHGGPPPAAVPEIVERRGCDLNPLDIHDPEHMKRMLSYIWADQPNRIERTGQAIAIARSVFNESPVDRADAADWLARRLEAPRKGQVHVVFHTIAWQYFPATVQRKCAEIIEGAGERATADAPIARLFLEAGGSGRGAAIGRQTWPGGGPVEIGRADFHGRWIDWFESAWRTVNR